MAMNEVVMLFKAVDQASSKLKNISSELDKLGEDGKKSGVSLAKLGKIAGGVTVALAALGAGAKVAFDMGKAGAAITQTTSSFKNLIGQLGGADDHLEQLRASTRGTVSDMNLMSSTATLLAGASGELGRQMTQATPQLLEIAKAAQKLNPSLGDTTFLYNSLAVGIKRGSPLILDNLGLVVSLGTANKKLAAQLGKTVSELTVEEQKMALLNETMRAGNVLVRQAGGDTKSATDSYDILTTAFKNLTDGIKENVHEGVQPYIERAGEAVIATDEWLDSLKPNAEEQRIQAEMTRMGADAVMTWTGNTADAIDAGREHNEMMAEKRILAIEAIALQDEEAAQRRQDVELLQDMTFAVGENHTAILALYNAKREEDQHAKNRAVLMGEELSAVDHLKNKQLEAAKAYDASVAATGLYSDESQRLGRVLAMVTEAMKGTEARTKEAGKAAQEAVPKVLGLVGAYNKLIHSSNRALTSFRDEAAMVASNMAAYDDMAGSNIYATEALLSNNMAKNKALVTLGQMTQAEYDLLAQQEQLTDQMENNTYVSTSQHLALEKINLELDTLREKENEASKVITDNTYATNINREATQMTALALGNTTEEIIAMEDELRMMTEDLKNNSTSSQFSAEQISNLQLRIAQAKKEMNGSAGAMNGVTSRLNTMSAAARQAWTDIGKLGTRMPGEAGGAPAGEYEDDPEAFMREQGYQVSAAGRTAHGHAADVWLDLARRHELDLASGHADTGWAQEFMQSGAGTGLASGFTQSEIDKGLELAKAELAARGAKHGANFIVPAGYENDSYMMGVSSGERVAVSPAHSTRNGAGGGVNVQNLYVTGVQTDSQLFEAVVRAARQRGRDFARVM